MKRLLPLIICLVIFPVFCIPGQEVPDGAGGTATLPDSEEAAGVREDAEEAAEEDAEDAEAIEKSKAETDYIEMDIKTSSLMELAAWCRELGLPEGGAREELASRLRTYYNVSPSAVAAQAEGRIITIESAKTTEYFTLEVVDEEYARLKGDVIISLRDGNATHRIKAWEILYNRTRNVISATGKVEYVKEEGGTTETFKGESITVNLDNWSSIFMDGASEKSMGSDTSAYRFAGTVISRNSEEVTVLTGADITNPKNEEAYWSLHASKLWLLPGNDWAVLNAVLKVGNIPVFYLPFFYYPADEIVFHPVLGFRTREGTFLQTTTYILGRPKTSAVAENSITKIFGSAAGDMQQKREGVFLRNTGDKQVSPNDTRLSVLFDAYVNLGIYLGTELVLPRKGPFGELSVSAGLGLTRNVYPMGNSYTPYPNFDGVSEWNKAMLFSLEIPFRFRLNVTGSFQINNGSLTWAIPYYSDPYVDRDFLRRTEVLDWLSMLREGATSDVEETENDIYLSSYEWRITGSFNPPVTALAPYISSLSISNISSSLLFGSLDSEKYKIVPPAPTLANPTVPGNPGRSFFFPSRFTMYSLSASVAGTPYTSGGLPAAQPAAQPAAGPLPAPGDAMLPDLPVSPWEDQKPADQPPAASPGAAAAIPQDVYSYVPPVLAQKFDFPASGGPRFSFDYRLTPTTASELQFMSDSWHEVEDVNWGQISSIISRVRTDGSIGFNVNHSGGGAYSGSLRISGTGSWQDYMYLNEEAAEFDTAAKVQSAKNRAYNETYFTSSWDFSAMVKPFYQSPVWNNTSLQYNLRGLLAKTVVDTSGSDPDWDWVFGKWDKSNIDTHQVTANVAANVMDYAQTLSVTAVLPPRDGVISGNATFRAWISETGIRTRVVEPFDNELRKYEPIYVTETLKFGTFGSFQQYVVFDPEKNEYTSLTSSLNLGGFSASYSVVYTRPYRFNPLFGTPGATNLWELQSDDRLEPQEFKLGYVKTFTKNELWGKRLSFSVNVNTSLTFDLQRYTNSRMSFAFGVNVGIANFLDVNFSTNSENSVIYRYFQKLPFFDSPPTELYSGAETNFFKDLANSFRFDREDLRKASGFKLKSLNLSLIHHLGDWNARLTMTMAPILDRTTNPSRPAYRFKKEISFLIQWVPIGEIKTQVDYIDEKLTVK